MNCARWREPDLTAVATLKSEVLQARCNNTPTRRFTAKKTIKAHIQHTPYVYLYVYEIYEILGETPARFACQNPTQARAAASPPSPPINPNALSHKN